MRASALHIGGRANRLPGPRLTRIYDRMSNSRLRVRLRQSEASRSETGAKLGTVNHRERVMLISIAIIAVALLVPVVIFLPSLNRIDE